MNSGRWSWLMAIALFVMGYATVCGGAEETSEQHSAGHEHEHHKNEVGLFAGLAFEHRENGVSLGVDYERRLSEKFGLGVLAEHTWGDLDFWVFAVPFRYHVNRWKFTMAPGVEKTDEHTDGLLRLVVSYEFPLESSTATGWGIGAAIDILEGEQVYMIGAALGFGF